MVDGMVQAHAIINKVNIKRATSSKICDYVYVCFIRYFCVCRDCFCGFDCQRESDSTYVKSVLKHEFC